MTSGEIIHLLRSKLEEQLATELGGEEDQKSFLELGMDSVIATELIAYIRQKVDPELSVSVLFDFPSIAQLAPHLAGRGHAEEKQQNEKFASIEFLPEPGFARLAAQTIELSNSEPKRAAVAGEHPYAPIAVVGLSGRFPDANNAEELWQNLAAGICSTTAIPIERSRYWDLADLASHAGQRCPWGGFIKRVEQFDPLFFGISPSEASVMDPQQRLFLEEAWNAIENAGYAGHALSEARCGIYAGVMNTDYEDLLTQAHALTPKAHELTGTAGSILASRIAYHLDFRGPAMAVDTACSSSMVAIHLACRALQLGEIDMALAGGVTLYLTQKRYNLMEQAGMLSLTGKCRPFDDAADGTIPGEGVGVVVLKRLEDAVRSRDSIRGVIVSTGTNQAGKTNGITAPSMQSQLELIREVQRRGNIDPKTIQYIEAHGTGTKLGDPIELEALAAVFRDSSRQGGPCRLGSLKANLGHTTAAAGVAGLIKVLLSMEHRAFPPQIHFNNPNHHTAAFNAAFRINTALEDWEAAGQKSRRAAISAFGFSGTNGHLVVEEAPARPERSVSRADKGFWIALSARTPRALQEKAADLRTWLQHKGGHASLTDLSFTLTTGRSAFEDRLAFVAHDLTEVLAGLRQFLGAEEEPISIWRGQAIASPPKLPASATLGEAWVSGVSVDWVSLYSGLNLYRLPLPGYPFERESYWYDIQPSSPAERGLDHSRTSDPSADVPALEEQDKIQNSNGRIKLKGLSSSPAKAPTGDVSRSYPSGGNPSTGRNRQGQEAIVPSRHSPGDEDLEVEDVRRRLRRLVAKTLCIDQNRVLDSKKLADLGLDSILAVELAKSICAEFKVNLAAARLYDHPSVDHLARYLGREKGLDQSGQSDSSSTLFTQRSAVAGSGTTFKSLIQKVEPGEVAAFAFDANEFARRVRSLIAQTLSLEVGKIAEGKKFADLGLDSILAVEVVKRLNGEFGVNLSAAALYSYPTTRQLASHIEALRSGREQASTSGRIFAPVMPRGGHELLVGSSTSDISVPSETRREDGQQTRHAADSEFHRVTIVRSGSIADLQLCHEIGPPPSPREVQISVKAASVMLADLLCVRGLYPTMPPYPFTPGFEVAGTVAVVGDQVVEFQPGDRVCGLTGANLGGHSGRVNVDPRLLVRINESLTFSDACTLPVSFLTANHSLFEIGRLSPEETLLIHSAASCTGLMAIQLAQRAGVRIFATVGSVEKIDYLRGIGVADVFDYRSLDLITELREAMPGGKVDVVLNLLTGPIRNLSLDLLSPGGRFLDLAVAGLKASAPPDLSLLVDNQGYFGVDCRRLSLRQPSIVADALKNLSTLVVSREIRPLPVSRHFALSEVRSAYELLESRTGIGRVILLPIEENFTSSPPGRILDNTSIQERLPKPAFEAIAVIGMAGRFPDAPDLTTFWQNLVSAKSSITEVGAERWPGEGPFRQLANSSDRYWGGFLDGIDEFDAPFFNIARAEAEMMDPQHRLFLQEAWKALEDAGYSPRDLAGESCGIFVGIGASDYYSQIREPDAHSLTGNLGSALVGRLAYLLDWTGPCLAVDTACASSFSAVHLACASLGRGECHLAMAGGVHIAPSPKVFVATTRMGLLSPTGRCQTFDATADGWVIGEGLGVVVLKRLQDAVRDGDHIHGVIRGCGINQDGAKNGFTAPKAESQTALQERVYQQAGVNPETIDYIEVHGMSSLLGDEIELHALKESFASFTRRKNFCQVGSLKPNIGHPIAAAGIACLLKVLLALRHRKLPSVAGLKKVNDALGLDDSPFYLNAELVQWKGRDGRPRRAAINGLSASGANCHLIVDEYVSESEHSPEIPGTRWSPGLFVLSAGAGSCLRESASNLLRFFEEDPDVSLPDVAFTLQVGRQEMDERLAFVADSLAEAKAKLSAFLKGETSGAIYRGCVEGADSPASLLASGDEGKHFIAAAVRNQALDKLGQLWTAGVQIDWSLLYQGPQPKRLSLPTYPFARERYWLQQPTNFNAVGSSHEPETKDDRRETVTSDTSLIDLLRDIIAGVLRCSSAEIDPDRDLFRYGFGSLYVLRVADQFEAVTGVRLPGRVFYQGRTIREIVRTVPDRMVVSPNERIQPAGGLPAKGGNGNSMGAGAVSTSDLLRPFPLSESQKALWSIQRSRPGSTAYHVPVGIFWNEPLDLLVLERAWQQLGQEQPALRTTFGFEVNEPFQVVHEKTTIRIEQESLVGLGDIEIRRRIWEIGRQPFDLEKGPLWRVQVFPVSLSRNILLVSLHHLIFDGHSLGLLLKGLEDHYRQILSGSQVEPGALPKRFGDYVQSERRYLASETFEEDLTYWVKQFPHGFAPLGITESSANRDAAGEVFQSKIPHSLVKALERLANQECVTLPSVFLTAFETILAVAGRQQEVVAGVAVDLRPPTGFEEVIGFFVNIIPIATNFSGAASFRDLLRRVFNKLLDSLEHRRLPFRRLVQALAADVGDPGDLQAAFYFHAWRSPEEHHFADRLVPEIHQAGEFDLVFEVVEASTDWLLNVKYRPGVFGLATIKKLITRFQDVLEIAARNPDDPVADLPREVRPGVAEPATSGFHYPRNRCVYQLIEDQVGRTPDAVAVLFEGSQLRYGELDARANQLAHHLVQAGVGPGSLIGVMLDRSLELPECLLAVWKTGAAYVPLDPGHPKERIEFILGNARVEVLLTHSGCRLRPDGIHTIEFDRQQETIRQRPIIKPLVPSSPEDLAYVIYTSGSTGKPKGVQIAHRSLTHFLWSMAERPGCTSDDYLLAATTICFDIAALELFLPLVTGARVEILPEEIAVNGLRFKEKIESSPATLIQGTPATWKMLLAAELGPIPRVKALCGGEAWGVHLAEQLLVRAREVWNMYGPTETTVWSSIQRVEPGQSVHLGDPIGNTQFYVFDESMRLVQPGEIGELFIGGDGLAKGYLNRPDLTGERFVPNPLRPEEIIYKTGDLVRHV